MEDVLTVEAIQRFAKQAFDSWNQERPAYTHFCHPIEYPFWAVFYDGKMDSEEKMAKWFTLRHQCFRKYDMGNRRGIEKWKLKPLTEQYEKKLAEL